MAQKTPNESLPNWPEPIVGGKYVRMLEKYVRSLRDADAHGNRQLFLDDVVIAHLLAFNPTLRSLRTIEDFSRTRQAQRHLSVRGLCKSTLSDFHGIADPTLLAPIVERLKSGCRREGIAARARWFARDARPSAGRRWLVLRRGRRCGLGRHASHQPRRKTRLRSARYAPRRGDVVAASRGCFRQRNQRGRTCRRVYNPPVQSTFMIAAFSALT